MKLLTKFSLNRSSATDKQNDHKYLPLTPNAAADPDNAYSEMLTFALSQASIKNIAITGPYGSGKSSVILTFQEKNPKRWKYLNISLATFKDNRNQNEKKLENEDPHETEENKESSERKDLQIEAVEKSILQQLFYSVEQGDLPRSRLKRIVTISKKSIYEASLFSIIWLSCGLAIFAPDNIIFKFANLFINPGNISLAIKYYCLSIFLLFSFAIIYLLFQYIEKIQELKLKFQDTELTLANKANDSILNTYLDEVLYFFEKTKFDVVIIEDLDRFDDPEIFIRLRELNTLINNAKQVGRHIVFIYAIKDSMFLDKDRTKFFDFIMPIIPVINPTNAYDFIKKNYINETIDKNLSDEIDDTLLHQASLYFDDMRLVINIFNEFNIYLKKLKSIKLDKNKLLAVIIYKNYNPLDFSNLHSNKGDLYDLFHTLKQSFISFRTEALEKEIRSIDIEIKKSNAEDLNSIEELRNLYIYEIYKKIPKLQKISTNGGPVTVEHFLTIDDQRIGMNDLSNDHSFLAIQSAKKIKWETQIGGYHVSNQLPAEPSFSFSEIEITINKNTNYKQREGDLNYKRSENRNELLSKRTLCLTKKDTLQHATLKEILEDDDENKIFNNSKHAPLLRLLVRNGYINERYPDYISFFIESVINLTERDFARRVLDNEPAEFETKLIHIDKIISKYLPARQCATHSILNIDLIDYIIINKDSYPDHFKIIFKMISDSSEQSIKFIFEFINKGQNIRLFINELSTLWTNFWDDISNNRSNDEIDNILIKILKNIDFDNIINLNNKGNLSNFLSRKSRFITFIRKIFNDDKKTIEFLKKTQPQFKFLECTDNEIGLFNEICKLGFFEINKEMICQIIYINSKDTLNSEIIAGLDLAPFNTFKNLAPDYLKEQSNEFINIFVDNLLINNGRETEEPEDIFLYLLNNSEIFFSQKVEIIKKNKTKISNIIDIVDEELWTTALEENKIVPTWDSLLSYYEYKGDIFSEQIVNFINQKENSEILAQQKINSCDFYSSFKEIAEDFETDLLSSDEIADTNYKSIQKFSTRSYTTFDISNLSHEKILTLLKNNRLTFNQENIENICSNAPSLTIIFIEINFNTFLENTAGQILLNAPELTQTLKLNIFTTEDKIKIIERDCLDFIPISDELRNSIIDIYNKSQTEIPSDFFEAIFIHTQSNKTKLDLLIHQLSYLDQPKITKYLNLLEPPYDSITREGRHTLPSSPINNLLAEKLYQKSYIYKPSATKPVLGNSKISFSTKKLS